MSLLDPTTLPLTVIATVLALPQVPKHLTPTASATHTLKTHTHMGAVEKGYQY